MVGSAGPGSSHARVARAEAPSEALVSIFHRIDGGVRFDSRPLRSRLSRHADLAKSAPQVAARGQRPAAAGGPLRSWRVVARRP